jgi:hypothetical protein
MQNIPSSRGRSVQAWRRLGLIYSPDTALPWQRSHAALPTKLHLGGSLWRIFFSSRDQANRAHIGRFDIDLNDPMRIIGVAVEPLLTPGPMGYFDDHGVQASSVVTADNGDLYLYYLGWNTAGTTQLFYSSIGLAVSRDGGETFQRYSPAPILQRSSHDPWMVSGPTVIRKGRCWLMYYLSGFRFERSINGCSSWYDVKIATSTDGIQWNRDGRVALPLETCETNISRMTIVEDSYGLRAWFPVKAEGSGYRCGYAESTDGLSWKRLGSGGLEPELGGWDSEAIDKMEVVSHAGKLFMFYNGNRFGFDGVGLAITDA